MFDEHEIRTFVYGTTRYFEVAAQQPATVGSPYLVTQGAPETAEYTGIINITGRRNGIVYFTAPRGMLIVMLMPFTMASPHPHTPGTEEFWTKITPGNSILLLGSELLPHYAIDVHTCSKRRRRRIFPTQVAQRSRDLGWMRPA